MATVVNAREYANMNGKVRKKPAATGEETWLRYVMGLNMAARLMRLDTSLRVNAAKPVIVP